MSADLTAHSTSPAALGAALERVAVLEEHVAHQQKALDEMSDQIAGQWKLIDQLTTKLDRLADRFVSLEMQSSDAPAITKPPHY